MLVFVEERLALLSVPKTGSTALQAALCDRADIVVTNPPELKHATVRRFDRFFQTMFRKMLATEMEIMGVVREPVDWLASWYRYRSRPELIGHTNSTRSVTFEEFVRGYLHKPRASFADVGSQTDFFRPRSNGAGAIHLFKYENQDRILNFLQSRLNCDIRLPRMNVSPKCPVDLNPETVRRYRNICAEEFRLHEMAQ
ncbi:sulfotransferase family 2 domain-containing protein [Ruegeria arenilitoris]|uniref:sulfotransferase family 2 domain-containing protein n=1 Tax=Ruegeria arenilitoris TaxID=1173585 RepID=UPI00147E0AD6|nr:sulfotransferase family 2 domain-containing protein [Ruegeria arenilitoris]